MPALLTRMSTGPSSFRTRSKNSVDRRFIRNVAALSQRTDAQLLDERGRLLSGLVPFAIADGDRCSMASKRERNRAPDSPRAARHDGYTRLQTRIVHRRPATRRKYHTGLKIGGIARR